MHEHGPLQREATVKTVEEKFEVMKHIYLAAKGFFSYFEKEWL